MQERPKAAPEAQPPEAALPPPSGSLCWVLQEKSQSAWASARPCCQGCSKELLQLLLDNRALMKMALLQSSRQRPVPRGTRAKKCGLWQRRGLQFSHRLWLPSSHPALGLQALAGDA